VTGNLEQPRASIWDGSKPRRRRAGRDFSFETVKIPLKRFWSPTNRELDRSAPLPLNRASVAGIIDPIQDAEEERLVRTDRFDRQSAYSGGVGKRCRARIRASCTMIGSMGKSAAARAHVPYTRSPWSLTTFTLRSTHLCALRLDNQRLVSSLFGRCAG
jgi:hypothetical protein